MTPLFTMRQAVEDPALLGSLLAGSSWKTWRALLIASRGEPLTDEELALFRARTSRPGAPPEPVEEMACVAGRRSGKTVAAACYAVYLAALCDWRASLIRGERGVMLFLAQSQRTARVAFGYAAALFDNVPLLSQQVINRTADTLALKGGIDIEIRPASFRGLRGITAIGVIADELSVWHSDDSANPDVEILNALRPALSTTGGPLLMISSPYAKKGELWSTYSRHFGERGDPSILVAHGASRDFNETLPQSVVDRAVERDPERARAEFLGEFRGDLASYVDRAVIEACVDRGIHERQHERRWTYFGFTDPSGGAHDGMTLAIAHKENKTVVLDAVREVAPPFSPEQVVEEFATLLKNYRLTKVVGDKYAGEWPRERFRAHGVNYEVADKTRSELYQYLLPLLNSRAVGLLDNPRLVTQIASLERRTGRLGKDAIDHAPNSHDDLANSVAGALALAWDGRAGGAGIDRPQTAQPSAFSDPLAAYRLRPAGHGPLTIQPTIVTGARWRRY